MASNQHREDAAGLHDLITGSSTSEAWFNAGAAAGGPPQWQRDVISRILALTFDQEIEYLSTAMPDGEDWDIVAFTQSTVVRVLVVKNNEAVSHIESVAFPRSSLDSLELVEVAPIPTDGDAWPTQLGLIGHYRSATLVLPLDKFASSDNQRDLTRLLTSLLQDLGH